ncbi:MAG: hypothetical protein WBB08_02335 [Halobacteriota archaeon]
MKSKGIVLVAVAIVAIGIFALPSSVSLFSGQHTWYDLSGAGNDVPCEKCHAEIEDEMGTTGAHENIKCEACHRTDRKVGGYALDQPDGGVSPGQGAHAASTQECMVCHSNASVKYFTHFKINVSSCSDCHPVPPAGGFGLTEESADTGEKAAHLPFINDSIDEPLMEGANEACIACHTRIGVNITWTKNKNLEFDASEDEMGEWTIPGFAAGGSDVVSINWTNEWTG